MRSLKRRLALAFIAAGVMVQACGEPPPPAKPVIRPVRYVIAQAAGGQRTRTFSGVARAGVSSTISFRVAGTIVAVDVAVGDRVNPGALLAALDPVDYELQVQETEASLRQAEARATNAAADLRRVRSLYENDNAARTDLDAATATSASAAAQVESVRKRLDLTRRKLDHTRLAAPAAGMIAEVLAEVDENVSAGQPVVVLASGSAPEVGFAVPEVLIRRIREGMAVTVRFDAIPEVRFAGAVTEVGVATLATGTTFPVTVRLNSNAAEIRPGMAAALDIVFGEKAAPDRFILPAAAISEDRNGRFVFVAEPEAEGMAVVRRRPVAVGAFAAGGLEVLDGLKEGERVVVAGVNRLRDGERVRLDAARRP